MLRKGGAVLRLYVAEAHQRNLAFGSRKMAHPSLCYIHYSIKFSTYQVLFCDFHIIFIKFYIFTKVYTAKLLICIHKTPFSSRRYVETRLLYAGRSG